MFYIPQIQKDDCGFACLKMVLASVHHDKNYLFLPQDETHGYYSYSDLMEIGEKHGVIFDAIRSKNKLELVSCPKFPIIVAVSLKNGAKHAVVVTKASRNHVTYIDPRFGKNKMKFNDFISIWDGTMLLIKRVKKMKYPHPTLNPIKKKTHLALSFIQLLSATLAVFGVYFIKDGTPFYLPIIFLSLAIIMELLMRIFTYKVMKNLDEYFFNEGRMPNSGFKEYLTRYEEYKKLVLSSPMNYLMTLIFTLALTAVILINDYRNILLVIVPVLLSLFRLIYINPSLKKKKQELEEVEAGLDYLSNGTELKNQARILHKKAYEYSYTDIICRYAFAIIIVVSTLLTMYFCSISSLPYLVFYVCLSMVLYRSFDQLISFDERILKFNLVKVKMINHMKL